jgi:hypothetical protein
MSSDFLPMNKYGVPLPRSERWGNMMYNADLEEKAREMDQIRANLNRNYTRSLTAPESVENPQNGNMKKNRNGSVYKWTTRRIQNNRGRVMGPHWQKVSNKFGYHINLGNAMSLERKHGFRFNKLLNNVKSTRKVSRRSTRKANRKTRRN